MCMLYVIVCCTCYTCIYYSMTYYIISSGQDLLRCEVPKVLGPRPETLTLTVEDIVRPLGCLYYATLCHII